MSLSFAQITDGCELPDMNLYIADAGSGNYNVLYNSSEDIGGIQFNVLPSTVIITAASGGAAGSAGYFFSGLNDYFINKYHFFF